MLKPTNNLNKLKKGDKITNKKRSSFYSNNNNDISKNRTNIIARRPAKAKLFCIYVVPYFKKTATKTLDSLRIEQI